MPPDEFHRLDAVSRHLPFAVDDYEAVNQAFAAWRASGAESDQSVVQIWLYSYIQRYFIIQFLRERGTPSEKARCVSRAMRRSLNALERIEDASKFASYVSVVCKNTLRNHRRDRRELAEPDDRIAAAEATETVTDQDRALIRYVFALVLKDMPEAIRKIGELRFLEGLEYAEIAERSGVALPTVRTYAARVMKRMREDSRIRALHYDDLHPADAQYGDTTTPHI